MSLEFSVDSVSGGILRFNEGKESLPPGYRWLVETEIFEAGDSYWHFGYHVWVVLAAGDYGNELIGQRVGAEAWGIRKEK